MGINEFGKKRVRRNVGRLVCAMFKANDVDLCLTFVLARREICRRGISEDSINEIDNLITKEDK